MQKGLTAVMRTRAETLLRSRLLADLQLSSYLEGCKDGLGLKGDWNFNSRLMQFESVEKEAAKDAVS